AVAVARGPERAPSRTADLHDVTRHGPDVRHVGAIDPRMSALQPLFSARRNYNRWCHKDESFVVRRTSHVARRTSHVARRTSHVARRTSHVARRTDIVQS